MNNIIATFNAAHNGEHKGTNYANGRETVTHKNVLAVVDGEIREIIVYRAYMGRSRSASRVYATIWVHDGANSIYCSGSGQAGGYGYHKESAAAAEAAQAVGFTFDQYLHGTGQIDEMLTAMAKALGYEKTSIFGHG
jgi:hypothetical protein